MHAILRMLWGNSKTFHPQFYEAFSSVENLYKNLSGNCSLLLSFEAANHVLAQLTGATIQEDEPYKRSRRFLRK